MRGKLIAYISNGCTYSHWRIAVVESSGCLSSLSCTRMSRTFTCTKKIACKKRFHIEKGSIRLFRAPLRAETLDCLSKSWLNALFAIILAHSISSSTVSLLVFICIPCIIMPSCRVVLLFSQCGILRYVNNIQLLHTAIEQRFLGGVLTSWVFYGAWHCRFILRANSKCVAADITILLMIRFISRLLHPG